MTTTDIRRGSCLKTFSDTIRKQLRKGDVLGRIGGEEFVVLLEDSNLATAQAMAERLRVAVEAIAVQADDGSPVKITASFGIALHDGTETVDACLATADAALYRAKQAGRNRVETD